MATSNGTESRTRRKERSTKWEGYSNYQEVSSRMSRSVSHAVDSYSLLQSIHKEGGDKNPDLIADARSDILSAAIPLFVEMQQEKDRDVEDYDDMLDRWEGENGYLRKLHEEQLKEGVPGWMFQLILDIRKAGWKLGYLQAGRRSKRDPDNPIDAEVENMFEGM